MINDNMYDNSMYISRIILIRPRKIFNMCVSLQRIQGTFEYLNIKIFKKMTLKNL